MPDRRRRSPRTPLLAAAVALALTVLLAGCAVPVRGMHGGTQAGMHAHGGGRMPMMHRTRACPSATPRFPGTVVRVHLMDMGRRGMMVGRPVLRLMAAPSTVRRGDVTFVASNLGRHTHELVVLPLPAGRSARLSVDAANKVSERRSLGEASAPCAAGAGDGLKPGTTGWVTLRLRPGRYELVCNEPHHYARGMHTIVVVR